MFENFVTLSTALDIPEPPPVMKLLSGLKRLNEKFLNAPMTVS